MRYLFFGGVKRDIATCRPHGNTNGGIHREAGPRTRTHTNTLNSTQRHIKEVGNLQHPSPTSLLRRDSHHHCVSSCSWRARPPPAILPFTISSLLTLRGLFFTSPQHFFWCVCGKRRKRKAQRFWKHNADGRCKLLLQLAALSLVGW